MQRNETKILFLIVFFLFLFIPLNEGVVNLKSKNNITYNYFNITNNAIETNVSINYGWNNTNYKVFATTPSGVLRLALSGIQTNISNTYNIEAGNTTAQMITAVNTTKLLINWTKHIKYNTTSQMITAVNTTKLLINWSTKIADTWNTTLQMLLACNSTGLLRNWSYVDTDTNTWNTTAQMIAAVNTTKLLINWSNKIPTSTGGHIGKKWLYNDSIYMYLNESKYNITTQYIADGVDELNQCYKDLDINISDNSTICSSGGNVTSLYFNTTSWIADCCYYNLDFTCWHDSLINISNTNTICNSPYYDNLTVTNLNFYNGHWTSRCCDYNGKCFDDNKINISDSTSICDVNIQIDILSLSYYDSKWQSYCCNKRYLNSTAVNV